MSKLLSVSEAMTRILEDASLMPCESVALESAGGRVLAETLAARRDQPPFPASAMDGYAVRAADIETVPCTLKLIGESSAGHGLKASIEAAECARIFTGAPVPTGADTIVIQENVAADGSQITVMQGESLGRYVRPEGLDFSEGDTLLEPSLVLDGPALSLAASMNYAQVGVRRKPKVAIISSGDELVPPGREPSDDQIITSNNFGVAELVRQAGGEPIDLGIAVDTLEALADKLAQSDEADIVLTLGGASVGDHDLVHEALSAHGVKFNFWKLAMRPGKPVMFGKKTTDGHTTRYLGLPGNPVSSLVNTIVFIQPLIRKHLGLDYNLPIVDAVMAKPLARNDQREEYMRGTFEWRDGQRHVTPFDNQDSSILSLLVAANCLLIRPAHAEAYAIGAPVKLIEL